VALHLYTL